MEAISRIAVADSTAGISDLSVLVGGTGESAVASSLAGYSTALGALDQAWKNDPRALWSSFAMIIVSTWQPHCIFAALLLFMY